MLYIRKIRLVFIVPKPCARNWPMGASFQLCVSIFRCRLRPRSEINSTYQSSKGLVVESACRRVTYLLSSDGEGLTTARTRLATAQLLTSTSWAGDVRRYAPRESFADAYRLGNSCRNSRGVRPPVSSEPIIRPQSRYSSVRSPARLIGFAGCGESIAAAFRFRRAGRAASERGGAERRRAAAGKFGPD